MVKQDVVVAVKPFLPVVAAVVRRALVPAVRRALLEAVWLTRHER